MFKSSFLITCKKCLKAFPNKKEQQHEYCSKCYEVLMIDNFIRNGKKYDGKTWK